MHEYIYPQNLTASAKLVVCVSLMRRRNLRDIAIIGAAGIISILALSQIKFVLPLALTAVYAFLTIRFDDLSVLDFIKRAVRFFLTNQQYYEWRLKREEKR